jgi:RNA-binding protein YlmH
LLANLDSAGRAKLTLSRASPDEELPKPTGTYLRDTVVNMRLDALLAGAFQLGRAEAKALIARGLVRVNHVDELRADYRLKENDLVSARGLGRFRLEKEEGLTKKGRQSVLLFRYGAPK